MNQLFKAFGLYALFILAFQTTCLAQAQSPSKEVIKVEKEKGEVYMIVEEMPEFPGGQAAMMQYISKNIHFPESARKDTAFSGCRTIVKFIVTPTGQVIDPVIIKGCNGCADCDKEALKVVNAMPAWKAGKQSGKAVSVYFNLPIAFRLK